MSNFISYNSYKDELVSVKRVSDLKFISVGDTVKVTTNKYNMPIGYLMKNKVYNIHSFRVPDKKEGLPGYENAKKHFDRLFVSLNKNSNCDWVMIDDIEIVKSNNDVAFNHITKEFCGLGKHNYLTSDLGLLTLKDVGMMEQIKDEYKRPFSSEEAFKVLKKGFINEEILLI